MIIYTYLPSYLPTYISVCLRLGVYVTVKDTLYYTTLPVVPIPFHFTTYLVLYWLKLINSNVELTELIYITELVNSVDVKPNGAVFCAIVSVSIAMYSRL